MIGLRRKFVSQGITLEQFDVGGPASVRAYPVSELLADSAMFASLEYTLDAPGFSDQPAGFRGLTWGEVLRVSFFADYAHGRVNKATPGDLAVFMPRRMKDLPDARRPVPVLLEELRHGNRFRTLHSNVGRVIQDAG